MKKALFAVTLVAGLFFASSVSAQVISEPGTLIKTPSTTAVYYLGEDGKRHAFPNSNVYFSWYDDFSTVKTISDFELSQIPLGKNVLYRSGARLIKTPSVNEVYAVGPWGELRNIASEQVAIALYGPDWAKLVDDIDISFFFDYHIVGVIDTDGENIIYPRGSLIHNDGLTWVIDTRSGGEQVARPISGQAWIENDFEDLLVYKYTGFITDQYEVGMPVYGKEVRFTCVYCDRGVYDNRTVFETNFLNIGVGPFSVSGQIPENWNVADVFSDQLTLDSSDGLATVSIDITEKADAGVTNLQEVLDQPASESVLYRDYDLVNKSDLALVSIEESKDMIRDLLVLREYDSHFVEFEFVLYASEGGSLEKHWDEIETILENIEVNRVAS